MSICKDIPVVDTAQKLCLTLGISVVSTAPAALAGSALGIGAGVGAASMGAGLAASAVTGFLTYKCTHWVVKKCGAQDETAATAAKVVSAVTSIGAQIGVTFAVASVMGVALTAWSFMALSVVTVLIGLVSAFAIGCLIQSCRGPRAPQAASDQGDGGAGGAGGAVATHRRQRGQRTGATQGHGHGDDLETDSAAGAAATAAAAASEAAGGARARSQATHAPLPIAQPVAVAAADAGAAPAAAAGAAAAGQTLAPPPALTGVLAAASAGAV